MRQKRAFLPDGSAASLRLTYSIRAQSALHAFTMSELIARNTPTARKKYCAANCNVTHSIKTLEEATRVLTGRAGMKYYSIEFLSRWLTKEKTYVFVTKRIVWNVPTINVMMPLSIIITVLSLYIILGCFKSFVRFNVMWFVAPYLNKYLFYCVVVYTDR